MQPAAVDIALVEAEARGTVLDAGQKQMVRTVATDRRRVQLVLAPAGAGKTTALKVLADHQKAITTVRRSRLSTHPLANSAK